MLFPKRFPARGRRRPATSAARLGLEFLERRELPSTFTVTDLGDAGAGSGLQGDLRYAITQANNNRDLSNHIQFQPGLAGTIVLSRGPLAITKDLAINGPGQDVLTISGNHQNGVFNITNDARVRTVRLTDLTIADGVGISVGSSRLGGGLYNDHAALTLTRVTVSGNSVAAQGKGGGIYNGSGALTLAATTIADNQTGDLAYGGGIYNDSGPLAITNSIVTGNSVGRVAIGGGLYNQTGTVTVSGSTVAGNTTGTNYDGGGIGGGGGVVIVDHSSISGNTGGGIETHSILQVTDSTVADNIGGPGIANGDFQIERSTISGNFDPAGVGGGVAQNEFPSTGVIDNSTITDNTALIGGGVVLGGAGERLTITQCTIVGNHAVGTGVTLMGGGGIYVATSAGPRSPVIGHSIVAGNDTAAPFTGADVDGTVFSLGSNFIGNGDASSGWDTAYPDERIRDHVGTSDEPLDPLLGPLQDNGGPTLTRAPLPGSPLRGLDTDIVAQDQRGSFRVFGAPGAVAANPAAAFRVDAPSVVTPGEPFALTVTAVDQWGNMASTYAGTVHFSSTDLGAQMPDDYTFGAADGGSHAFTVVLQSAGLQTVAIQDTASAALAIALDLFVDGGQRRSGSAVRDSLAVS
jgi:hypothetical protein